MNHIFLQTDLNESELQESYRRNHFDQAVDFWEYRKTYDGLKNMIKCRGLWKKVSYEEICAFIKLSCSGDGDFILGAVTLGNEYDQYELEQNAAEDYSEVYRMDCIAMDMLKVSYEDYGRQIAAQTGQYLKEFQFLGEDLPIELIGEILPELEADQYGITCNDSFMMTPKKTVVFLAELVGDKEKSNCHICDNCGNLECGSRKPTTASIGMQD